jgi:hypothetical protein
MSGMYTTTASASRPQRKRRSAQRQCRNQLPPAALASPSALAFTMVQKYVVGLPPYRQEQQSAHLGVDLSRQAPANWLLRAANAWHQPLYGPMHSHLLKQEVLHADETTVQVLRGDGRAAALTLILFISLHDSLKSQLCALHLNRLGFDYPRSFGRKPKAESYVLSAFPVLPQFRNEGTRPSSARTLHA